MDVFDMLLVGVEASIALAEYEGNVYALSVAGFMFSRLLFLPLWRIVREQEDANSSITRPA